MPILLLFLLTLLPQTKPFAGRVVSISDGDTCKILYENREVKVRLVHIDCPEKRQPFGTRARQELSQLVFGKTVVVRPTGTDRYGRVLAEIFVGDKCVNKLMVQRGYAWHFKKYSTHSEYARLERQARQMRMGLWQDSDPTAPWDWRKMRRK